MFSFGELSSRLSMLCKERYLVLKEYCLAEIIKFRLAFFPHVILPNVTKYTTYLDKKVLQGKTNAVVWRWRAALQRLKRIREICFIDRRSRNQASHSCEIFTFLPLVCLFRKHLLQSLLAMVSSNFQVNKLGLKLLALIMQRRYFSLDSVPLMQAQFWHTHKKIPMK